jgi:hypothetical protein
MITTFRCIQAQRHVDNPKPDRFGIGPGTAGDIVSVLQIWQHNPEGIPLPIHGESDGTLNISDINIWMWLKKLSLKSRPTNVTPRAPLISLFSKLGQWHNMVEASECLTTQGDTPVVHHIALPDRWTRYVHDPTGRDSQMAIPVQWANTRPCASHRGIRCTLPLQESVQNRCY